LTDIAVFHSACQRVFPQLDEARLETLLWSRTGYPCEYMTSKQFYKMVSGVQRAEKNGIILCDFCPSKIGSRSTSMCDWCHKLLYPTRVWVDHPEKDKYDAMIEWLAIHKRKFSYPILTEQYRSLVRFHDNESHLAIEFKLRFG
jgi:hypothetical protein